MRLILSTWLSAILLLFVVVQASSSEGATSGSYVELHKVDDSFFNINGKGTSGFKFKDIPVKKRKIDAKWMLQLKFGSGMRLEQEGKWLSADETISSEQLKELITIILYRLKESGINPDVVQIDIGLVDAYRTLVVSTIKNTDCKMQFIENKNLCLSKELRRAFNHTQLTQDICKLVEQSGLQCLKNAASMNEVAFSPGFVGKPWIEALNANDAGVYMFGMWLSIRLQRKN